MKVTLITGALVAMATALPAAVEVEHELEPRQACVLPAAGDSPGAFINSTAYSTTAGGAAAPPAPYQKTFGPLKAATSASGYLTFIEVSSYNTTACAERCNSIDTCKSFNIYYERSPRVIPSASCPNPASLVIIKCSFWNARIDSGTATNGGQYREQFQVLISGSSGYSKP